MSDAQEEYTTQGRVDVATSVSRISDCYQKESSDAANTRSPLHTVDHKTNAVPYRLSELLGKDPQQYWWRLYINPKHYGLALKKYPQNPGIAYDKEALTEHSGPSPGYQAAMINAFKTYLDYDSTVPAQRPILNVKTYREMFLATSKDVKTNLGFRAREATRNVQYPTAPKIAADLAPLIPNDTDMTRKEEMMIHGKRLAIYPEERSDAEKVKPPPNPTGDSTFQRECSYYTIWVSPIPLLNKGPQMDSLACPDWDAVLAEVFSKFENDMSVAPTRIKQLEAIARVIRRIHMLHIFTDGNKRVNVHLLLSYLLLKFRFGLPLGGKYIQALNKPEALDEMFQGGYTVVDIARFLWIAQDFGLLSESPNDTIIKK